MEKQRTISKEISLEGAGLHTGEKVRLKFKPAGPDTGIRFQRVDLATAPVIQADVSSLLDANFIPRRTSIGKDGVFIYTVEHLLAALSGLGIDNIVIEIDGVEVPGLDGSAKDFLDVLKEAGVKEQDGIRKSIVIREPLWIEEGNAFIAALPSQAFKISYTMHYENSWLGSQYLSLEMNPDSFATQLAGSRTFVLEEEIEGLKSLGLGKGADRSNTLVVGKKGVGTNTLRFPDEFIRHKILDLVGDMYLLGGELKAHLIGLRSGHALNIRLLKKIEAQYRRYETGGIKSTYTCPDTQVLDVQEIMQILPHRYPFLFLDKVVHLEKGKKAVGIKNVTINDSFFAGHFPGRPVMPGVLIIEAMAQLGGVMMLATTENKGKIVYFMAINNAKFRKTVLPGDQLVLETEAVKIKSRTGQVRARALVEGKVVAEADLMFALAED